LEASFTDVSVHVPLFAVSAAAAAKLKSLPLSRPEAAWICGVEV
jgi:hypothetical protein